MSILLRNLATGFFFKANGKWTNNPNEALAFLNVVRAFDYSVYHGLNETVVIDCAATEKDLSEPMECCSISDLQFK